MAQVTLDIDDELIRKAEERAGNLSEYVNTVLHRELDDAASVASRHHAAVASVRSSWTDTPAISHEDIASALAEGRK